MITYKKVSAFSFIYFSHFKINQKTFPIFLTFVDEQVNLSFLNN
jgi:hypothetical protein